MNAADFNDEEKLDEGKEMLDQFAMLGAIIDGLKFGARRNMLEF